MATLTLPLHSYTLRSHPASSARLINCFPEPLPPDAKTPFLLTRCPGIASFAAIGTGPIRGFHRAFGSFYVVSGTTLYKVAQDGTASSLGVVGSGRICMAHNVDTLVVVSAPNAFYTNGTAQVTQITDPDYTALGAKYVRFLDNYLVFTAYNGSRFFWADVGTATDFDALSFATPEGAPDDIIGFESDHLQAILLGTETVEIWEADSTGFSRAINGFIELGCYNGDTVARIDNSIMWLANDYTVRRLNGTTPERKSTYAVEQFLSGVDVTSGRAYSYSQDGHIFYVLSFSTGCWVYDATTNEWHERGSHPEDYFRWQYAQDVYGRQFVGDYYSNKVGYFDPETYAEYGEVQRMAWTYQPVYSENRLAIHHELEVVLETGVGLTLGQGSDPEVMLAYSDDGGITWTNLPNRKIGKKGEYRNRVRWNSLGSSSQRVYRAAISDPVKVVVTDTVLKATGARI